MITALKRLESGERWWRAEFVLRSAGLLLLVACGLLARWTCRLVSQPPQHQATPLEFAVAALAALCLSTGIALLFEGPGLFRLVPIPSRAWLP